jgi:hypothetical protein
VKLLVLSMLGMCLCVSSIQAVQVIELRDPRAKAWSQFGEDLGKSIGQGIKDGYNQAREKAILDEILKDYEPSKNSTFVLKVLQSELSPHTKEMVMNALNEQHKMYLYERATK